MKNLKAVLLRKVMLFLKCINLKILIIQVISDGDNHPVQTVAHLMKLSFDEGHRQAICQLGGIHTIASLVEVSIYFNHILYSHLNKCFYIFTISLPIGFAHFR